MLKILTRLYKISLVTLSAFWLSTPAIAQTETPPNSDLNLKPEILNNSPVLQRWRRQIPNVLKDIQTDPSFRTRLRFGYSTFPTQDAGGFQIGVEDLFIAKTGLTLSGDYQQTFNHDFVTFGTNFNYYLLPLGSYVNIAPVLGYRSIEVNSDSTSGVNLGAKLMLVPSRGGAADLALSQNFIAPGSDHSAGMTTLSLGYAVTRNLRLATDIQFINTRESKDRRLGIILEWML